MTVSLPRGCTALHAAAKMQLFDVCDLLIDNRADLNARDSKKECGQYI
jgi:ankyrin repeat protein